MTPSLFQQNLKAIVIALLGWFSFSMSDVLTKLMTDTYPVTQLIFMTAVTGLILSTALILFRFGWRGFVTANWKLFLLRGILVIAVSYTVISALSMISLSDFYGIIFTTPFFVTIMSVLFLQERIGIHRIAALIMGFIGVVVLSGPRLDSEPLGLLFALGAAFLASIVTVIIRKIGREPVWPLFAFVPCLANVIVYGPLMMIPGQFHMPDNALMLTLPLLCGVTTFLGFLGFSIGFTRATETAVITPFHYSQMMWGVLFGFLIFNDVPTLTTIIGSVIILSAGLYMLWREYVHHQVNHSASATVSAAGTTALPET